ncbi:MAG: hypothetical protein K2X38_01105 [Gemmataceae bacterium]|nr:hypothetical protein [Gemmataceae bacterium]
MAFAVHWSDSATEALAEAYLTDPQPNDVTYADRRIQELLTRDPFAGEYLSEGLWVLKVPPLRVNYEVVRDTREVKVSDAFHVRK